jgi:hypothetical protein
MAIAALDNPVSDARNKSQREISKKVSVNVRLAIISLYGKSASLEKIKDSCFSSGPPKRQISIPYF